MRAVRSAEARRPRPARQSEATESCHKHADSQAGAQMCAQCLHLLGRQLAVEQLTDLWLVTITAAHPSAPPFVCFDAYRSGRFPLASRKSQSRRRHGTGAILLCRPRDAAPCRSDRGQAVELAQDEDLAGVVRQTVEPARDGAAHFAARQLLLGTVRSSAGRSNCGCSSSSSEVASDTVGCRRRLRRKSMHTFVVSR